MFLFCTSTNHMFQCCSRQYQYHALMSTHLHVRVAGQSRYEPTQAPAPPSMPHAHAALLLLCYMQPVKGGVQLAMQRSSAYGAAAPCMQGSSPCLGCAYMAQQGSPTRGQHRPTQAARMPHSDGAPPARLAATATAPRLPRSAEPVATRGCRHGAALCEQPTSTAEQCPPGTRAAGCRARARARARARGRLHS